MSYQSFDYHNYEPTLGEIINAGVPIWNDWWNTFVPEYKEILCRKIERKFYFNQIGAETPDRFVHYLNQTMEEIMPYYNQLYQSELIKFDPMMNHFISTDGRTIENMLKAANTKGDKYGKLVRDFIEKSSGSGVEKTKNTRSEDENLDKTAQNVYNKDGKEQRNDTDSRDRNGNETREITYQDKDVLDRDTTSKNTTNVVQKEVTDGSSATEGTTTGKSDWTEKVDDDSTTGVKNHLSENTQTNSRQDYADTPQTILSGGSVSGEIRQDYLTNVTWNNGSETHTSDSTSDTTYADDKTTTHNGTDTTTVNSSDTVSNTIDTTKDITENGEGTEDTTKTTTGTKDETINTTSHEEGKADQTKTWEEHGGSKDTITQGRTSQVSADGTVDTTKSSMSSNVSNENKVDSEITSEDTTRTTDTGNSSVMKGFMNVSSSQLLQAFRDTFINVDRMIFEELKTCFQMVF